MRNSLGCAFAERPRTQVETGELHLLRIGMLANQLRPMATVYSGKPGALYRKFYRRLHQRTLPSAAGWNGAKIILSFALCT